LTEPPQLDPHTVVLLRWPDRLPDLTDDELDAQPDERWRGLSIYRVPPEEAREYIEQDPSVRRGRLTYDAWTWLVPVGDLQV